jgi:glycosyltransferase involved in cell wall biosynthesis
MKVLIATGIFKPEPGGPATYAAELGRRLHSTGHPVTVVTYSNKAHFDLDTSYPFIIRRVVRTRNKIINYYRYFSALMKEIEKHSLIYTLDWFSAGLPVMLAAKRKNKKYIVRVGGGYIWEKYLSQGKPPVTLKEFYERKMYRRYYIMYYIIKKVLQNASWVIFNSDDQRELYHKYYKLDPHKTSVIYNPVPENKFGTLVRTYEQRFARRDKEIVFAGRFIKMKNVEAAVRAFHKLEDKEFRLLLIGEGPTESLLRQLVTDLKLEDRVEFLPSMSQMNLYRRIINCYYLILPSWTDVSPNQINEAMSLGIPFLLTKENYLSINNQKFLTIDPNSVDDIANKMNSLLDPRQYEAFIHSLSKLSMNQTWNHAVVEHMRIFTQVAKA